MLEFLKDNISTIIVGAIVLCIIVFIVKSMIKDKKSGKSSCSCGCSGCPNSSMCHGDNK